MTAVQHLFVVLVVGRYLAAHAASIDGAWQACSKADPKLNECMSNSLTKFIPLLKGGVAKYDVPELDPVAVGDLDLSTSNLKFVVKGVKMQGLLSDFKLSNVEAEPDNYKLRIVFRIPKIDSKGQYELNGKLMIMPVTGTGTFQLIYEDATLDMLIVGKPVKRDGKTFVDIEEVKVELIPANLKVKAENLFNGNKELSDNFHKFVGENWHDIYDEFKGKLWADLGKLFKKSLTKLWAEYPQELLYLP